jgi:hypothetical protein
MSVLEIQEEKKNREVLQQKFEQKLKVEQIQRKRLEHRLQALEQESSPVKGIKLIRLPDVPILDSTITKLGWALNINPTITKFGLLLKINPTITKFGLSLTINPTITKFGMSLKIYPTITKFGRSSKMNLTGPRK